jgi:2-polyprenyl-3-methyl-5-hydroxy-6-metoxy-1,4-benzoquinol methylase
MDFSKTRIFKNFEVKPWKYQNQQQAATILTPNPSCSPTFPSFLGCVKGAVSIQIARELNYKIVGVDIFEPFITEANQKAREFGISHLCQYKMADMRDVLETASEYDIVLFTAVGGVLGNFEQCIRKLRRSVRRGGYMIIDDGFRRDSKYIPFPGYEHYVAYPDTIAQLTTCGDKIMNEKIFSKDAVKAQNKKNTDAIANRVEKLAAEHPEMSEMFYDYLDQEIRECEILENDIAWAVWMLQKV